MKKKPNQKHLKISDRILIESMLTDGALFKDIASVLSKDPTSISKEIRKHRVWKEGRLSKPRLIKAILRAEDIEILKSICKSIPMQKQESVSKVFTRLKNILESLGFSETFPVFLTDNGSEFSYWIDFLTDEDGLVLFEIFYCDSNAAWQKGRVEKNHEYIEYFIPKARLFVMQ